jgi:hypothetical protein
MHKKWAIPCTHDKLTHIKEISYNLIRFYSWRMGKSEQAKLDETDFRPIG